MAVLGRRAKASDEARLARQLLASHGYPDADIYVVELVGDLLSIVAFTVPDHGAPTSLPPRRCAMTGYLWADGTFEVAPGWD